MADSIDSLLARLLPAWSAALKGEVSEAELARFARRHRAELTELLQAADKRRPPQWFERFNPRGAPGEDIEAAQRAAAHAADLFDHIVHLLSLAPFDLDLQPALDVLGSSRDDPHPDYPFDERWWLDNDAAIRPDDLPLVVGTSAFGWTPEETGDLIADVLESDAMGGYVDGASIRRSIAERLRGGPDGRLELVSLDKDTACAFIVAHHTALPYCNPRGMMYAIGARFRGQLVAVATAGTPTGRWGESAVCPVDGILELSRIASVGGLSRSDRRGRVVPVNASSALAARLLDLLPESGRRGAVGCRFVTYSLTSERASTYLALVAKGLRPVARRRGKRPSGARGSTTSLPHLDKIVWEAGPAARPPDWSLVAVERRAGAQRAFEAFMRSRRSRGRPREVEDGRAERGEARP